MPLIGQQHPEPGDNALRTVEECSPKKGVSELQNIFRHLSRLGAGVFEKTDRHVIVPPHLKSSETHKGEPEK